MLPLILLAFCVMGAWSINTASEGIRKSQFDHLTFLMDRFFQEELDRAITILNKNSLNEVNSFVEAYQLKVTENAKLKFSKGLPHMLIFGESGNLIFSSNSAYNNEELHDLIVSYLPINKSNTKTLLQGHLDTDVNHVNFVARFFSPWKWHIFITTTDEQLNDSIAHLKKGTFGIATLSAFGCFLVIILMFRYFLVTPIKELKKRSQAIANRQKIDTLGTPRNDELGALAQSIEVMSKDIYAYQASLVSRKEILEGEVLERTNELEKEKQLAQKYLDVAGVMLVALDKTGLITMINSKGCDLLEVTAGDVLGKNWFDNYLPKEINQEVTAVFKKLIAGDIEPVEYYENVVVNSKGLELAIAFHNTVLKDEKGNTDGILFSGEDITDRKQAEAENEKLEEQLRQAHKMEAIGTLSGGIAHDFNNLLAAILGYAEMAQDDVPGDHPARNSIEQVLIAGNRAKEIVKQILSFSRKEITKKVPLQFDILVNEALNLLRATIPTTIEIRPNITPACGTVLADPNQIHQVLMNLCTNAAQALDETGGVIEVSLDTYMSEKGTIVSGVEDKKYIRLTIEDNGPGIDNKIQEKIFDPYFTTKEVGKGSGMGLAVVIGIVKSHDGRITVNSKVGEGTTFTVYFPMVDESIQHNRRINDPIPTGSERILIVDDDTIVIGMTKRKVERLGYQVTTQTSSAAALDLFRYQPDAYDLVISDQTMPELTGDKLANKLKEIRPDIPIIICSGYSSRMDAEQAEHIGISAFIMKPFESKELSRVIRSILDGKTVS
jgi:PAS domain S-box-containing protein